MYKNPLCAYGGVRMLKYIIKRLLAGVLTMVVLITVAFFMMHAMPGGPFSPSEEKNVPIEVLERIAASYGLDQPVWKQYLTYWNNLLHGDLGISYKTVGTVNEKISGHFPYSAQVGGLAVLTVRAMWLMAMQSCM